MTEVLYRLPTVIILGCLVLILAFMRDQHQSVRFQLWRLAWVIVFARIWMQFAAEAFGLKTSLLSFLGLTMSQASAILFFLSVTAVVNDARRRTGLALALLLPSFVGALVISGPWYRPWLCVLIFLVALGLGFYFLWRQHGFSLWFFGAGSVALTAVSIAIYQVQAGRPETGYHAISSTFAILTAILFYRTFRRWSPGVITGSIGFLVGGSVFPLIFWTQIGTMSPHVIDQLWMVPRFLVAIGMIVVLLEEALLVTETSRAREKSLNDEMRRYAELTSRLLSGAEPAAMCSEVAKAICEAGNYQRVAICLNNDRNQMFIAGHSGIADRDLEFLRGEVSKTTVGAMNSLCVQEVRVGPNTFRTNTEKLAPYGAVLTQRKFAENPYWHAGDELLVPLRTHRENVVGMISLDDPKVVERVTAADLAPIELLAGDLAGAIENANLQQQLFQSEKLAGMGRLVSGVAHELNNPLTAVLGYAEMLADRVQDSAARHDLDVMRREALRMKRIIESLQRFSRQQVAGEEIVKAGALVQDVAKLRSFELQDRGIELQIEVKPGLPGLMANEMLLQQVLLNILDNAIDAVESAEVRRIRFEVKGENGKILLRVTDTGPGFADASRAFDPFYSTKAVGKGTGLGLSLCYGIVRDHGGEISASNLQPNGACVTILLPTAEKPEAEKSLSGQTRT